MFTVMIVEDLEVMRRQIKRLPIWEEDTGFEIVCEAEDGQDALEKLQLQPVDLIITDIKMPRIDGIELLREVYEKDLATCVVFLSEHSEFNFAKKAIEYGIFDYLVKPVNPNELKRLLNKAKKYIEEKKETQIQQKMIEDKIFDKIDIYYPINQLNFIVNYISEGDKKAILAMSDLVDSIATALECDATKTAIVAQKAYNEIWTGIKTNNMWIEKYVDINSFIDISLLKYDNIELIKNELAKIIETIISLINRFILKSNRTTLIREICNYVIENVEKEISLSKISEALFLTKNYIGDIFKQETGMTVGEYTTMVKVERAKKIVIEENFKIYEIAQRLGYENTEYFGKLFKRHTGLSPIEYKNKNK